MVHRGQAVLGRKPQDQIPMDVGRRGCRHEQAGIRGNRNFHNSAFDGVGVSNVDDAQIDREHGGH